MTEIESLQERIEAIRRTGDPELASRAWRAISTVIIAYTREKKRVRRYPLAKRVTPSDAEWFLQELATAQKRSR